MEKAGSDYRVKSYENLLTAWEAQAAREKAKGKRQKLWTVWILPAHPEPSGMPRDWVKEQILHLVKAANQYGSKRNAFEFLTGRPLSANETYGEWFATQLDEQIGELSDAQMFTLFVWAHTEWQRARNGRLFSLPINGSGLQFAVYSEQKWQIGQES